MDQRVFRLLPEAQLTPTAHDVGSYAVLPMLSDEEQLVALGGAGEASDDLALIAARRFEVHEVPLEDSEKACAAPVDAPEKADFSRAVSPWPNSDCVGSCSMAQQSLAPAFSIADGLSRAELLRMAR